MSASIQVLQLLTTKSHLILCGVHTGKAAAASGYGLPPCSFAHALSGLRCKVALPTVACRPPACSAGAEVVLSHLTMLSPWGGELLFLQNVGRVLFCFFSVCWQNYLGSHTQTKNVLWTCEGFYGQSALWGTMQTQRQNGQEAKTTIWLPCSTLRNMKPGAWETFPRRTGPEPVSSRLK